MIGPISVILLSAVWFYVGWRLGRNRAMAELIVVARFLNHEAKAYIDDAEKKVAAGIIMANHYYLEVTGKL